MIYNLHSANYSVSGLPGLTLSEALRFWKAKFETFKHFKRDVIKHSALEGLCTFVEETWDTIQPITVQEALREQNMEKRRTMFNCIGVSRLFTELSPELLDRQVIHKVRTRWNEKNRRYTHTFDDIYELYQLEGDKLFTREFTWSRPNPVYAVRCWCTTTKREYWIYVPMEIALGIRRWLTDPQPSPDAVRAIAWTIRIDISNPKRIFRQGDIIVAEESDQSSTVNPYHLCKEEYLRLMYSET
jgi:hypothetical protein